MKKILTLYGVCALAIALMVPLAQSQPAGLQAAIKSEQANKLVEKTDRTYMRSTDFSPMK